MTRILIADDSATSRSLFMQIFQDAPHCQVVGQAINGQQAVDLTLKLRPEVVLMDIVMPGIDGLEATREIMRLAPTPIVMISGAVTGQEADYAFRALRHGALTLLVKPVAPTHPEFAQQAARLITTVRSLAQVKVIHHRPPRPLPVPRSVPPPGSHAAEIVGIAASTGGPAALAEILGGLPADFPLPIVIAQHISPDFLPALRDWLRSVTRLRVVLAEAGDAPAPHTVYLAQASSHLRLTPARRFEYVALPQARHMPSGNLLLGSLAQVYQRAAVGVVLTGMGDDGAEGLHQMAQAGAITIAQDEASSIVFGMPKEAIQRHAAGQVLPLPAIASFLSRVLMVKGSVR